MDVNGYNPSILQEELDRCFICGGQAEKLDRHEIFGGALRKKSKKDGLWIMLCHQTCHLGGVHKYPKGYEYLKRKAQKAAMEKYGWTKEEFINQYGRNYIE